MQWEPQQNGAPWLTADPSVCTLITAPPPPPLPRDTNGASWGHLLPRPCHNPYLGVTQTKTRVHKSIQRMLLSMLVASGWQEGKQLGGGPGPRERQWCPGQEVEVAVGRNGQIQMF